MAVTFRRIAGAVRQGGKLVPLEEGEPVPPPETSEPGP